MITLDWMTTIMPINFIPSHHLYHLLTMEFPYPIHPTVRVRCSHYKWHQQREWNRKRKWMGVSLEGHWWIWHWNNPRTEPAHVLKKSPVQSRQLPPAGNPVRLCPLTQDKKLVHLQTSRLIWRRWVLIIPSGLPLVPRWVSVSMTTLRLQNRWAASKSGVGSTGTARECRNMVQWCTHTMRAK